MRRSALIDFDSLQKCHIINILLLSLLIFQPIPRAPASAPCSSPSCPSSSSSSPCRSPYASRSRRVPTQTCLTLFETKTRTDFAQRPAATSGKQGWQNLAKYWSSWKKEIMDPTPKKTTSGKNSNLAWVLQQTSPPSNKHQHPNNNLHSSRTWRFRRR